MGRTEPSAGRPPASFRRDARAKWARVTVNKVIPAVLAAHPRARRGVEASELIVDPPPPPLPLPSLHVKPAPRRARDKGVGAPVLSSKLNRRDEGGGGWRDGRDRGDTEGRKHNPSRARPRISLRVADTLEAAYSMLLIDSPGGQGGQYRDLSNTEARVGVLNMASPLVAGGGFRNGATSQEEMLCARTTLLPALRDEFYRLPELGVAFTADVLVFRGSGCDGAKKKEIHRRKTGKGEGEEEDGNEEEEEEEQQQQDQDGKGKTGAGIEDGESPMLPKPSRWFVDVASAAMLRMPEVEVDSSTGWAVYASPNDRELVICKMRAVMRVFAAKGVRRVVLGAWGCGAYGNPVGEIARAWRRVLVGGKESGRNGQKREDGKENGDEKGSGDGYRRTMPKAGKEKAADSWDSIEHIVFAIKDSGMARAFAGAFGEELLELAEEEQEDISGSEEKEGDGDDQSVRELRAKIQELELRVEQARTQHLRAGLNSVLAGLRSQLPGFRDSSGGPLMSPRTNSSVDCGHDESGGSEEGEDESEDDDKSTEKEFSGENADEGPSRHGS
ncbi:hypothetical protein AAE478_001356 [Parahypoxylon ruwenzoriense]